MKAYTYIEKGLFAMTDKPKPEIQESTDAIVRVTLSSICTSDLHIKHGSVPRAVPGNVHVPTPLSPSWHSMTSHRLYPYPTCTTKTSHSRLAA